MFIHGSKDDFVPTEMSTVLFNEKKGIKAIYYAQGAEHARALNVDQQLYQEAINNFLKELEGEVIEIKYQVSSFPSGEEQIYCFSAMIIYFYKQTLYSHCLM